MSHRTVRRALGALAAVAVAAAGIALGGVVAPEGALAAPAASTAPAGTAAAGTAPTPVVDKNLIKDSRTGATWTAHAVNWPSFEYACQQGWGDSADGATAAAAQAMVSWGITAVRVPLNEDCWLGSDGSPKSPITTSSYQAALSTWVGILNAAGLVVILDLHWTAPTGFVADGQRAMPDAQSTTFWSQVAAAYKDRKSVMFETFNEPYSRNSFKLTWACWKDGGCHPPSSNDQDAFGTATYTAVGQATLVSAIRAAGATQPILLDGLNYANDLTGWLANRPSDSQLIASWHNYPGQGCSDTTCWNSQALPVAATVPVIATEFGETDGGSSFMTAFMAWADAHAIGYAPWAWWVVDPSEGTDVNLYALISNLTTFTPRAPEGTAFHDHLAALAGTVPPPTPPTPPAAAANSPAMSFVLAAYTDVLNRTPSTSDSGVQYWVGRLAAGGARGDVAGSFTGSDEYRMLKITAAYADVLGRTPDPGGAAYWLSLMQRGVMQPDDTHRTFLSTDEFYVRRGGGTDAGYVSALYQDVIGRAPDPDGLSYWVGVLHSRGRGAVVDGLWYATETFNVRVTEAFNTLLGRGPSGSDLAYWAGVARQIGLTGLRTQLMSTDEYWARAGARFP